MEASYYTKEKDYVLCKLCPRHCKISSDEVGYCKVRKNVNGKLISLVYGKAIALAVDPIEKKPLFHFYPGMPILSFGTVGCNLRCKFCQNFEISHPTEIDGENISPSEIVNLALERKCKMIAATYNEPTIFFEYMIDTFKLAKEKNLKTVVVSNGFIEEEPLRELLKFTDAINIDLKSFDNKFYTSLTTAWLEPVLRTIKIINESSTHLEITNLVIPGKNEDFESLCSWVVENVGKEVPLHFSAFYPMHKMLDIERTSKELLDKAFSVAKEKGILHVYHGNIRGEENTYCSCGELLVERIGYEIISNNVKKGKCKCGKRIKGCF